MAVGVLLLTTNTGMCIGVAEKLRDSEKQHPREKCSSTSTREINRIIKKKKKAGPFVFFHLTKTTPAPHLTHEGWYHPVEDGVLESKPFFSGAEGSEVFCSLGDDMGEKLYGDRAQRLPVGRHCEEHSGVRVSGVLLNSGHLRRGT